MEKANAVQVSTIKKRNYSTTWKRSRKKIEKIENTVMYSFQAKIGFKKMRKCENKNYRFVPFLPNAKLKIPKK